MGVAWVILFPLGAIVIRFFSTVLPIPAKIHSVIQSVTALLVLAAGAAGFYLAWNHSFTEFRISRPVIS